MTPAPAVPGGGRPRAGGRDAARDAGRDSSLDAVLDQQRRRDVIGREANDALRTHSAGYAALVDGPPPASVVDLGSGGGVPGLILAVEHWPSARFVLLDASQRRCTYLELCVAALDLADRVAVHWGRAEEAGRLPTLRATHDLVVARSFGPPAATAEGAAPLLRVGGALVVSDPPGSDGGRWDPAGLEGLGLRVEETRVVDGATYTRMRQVEGCPDAYPRRSGVPERRPLF